MTTIFALATGAHRSAIAIMRLSGPEARPIVERLAANVPPPRQARLRTLRAVTGEALDSAVVLFWEGPRSYTGEDCAELHLHGGPAVLHAVADALIEAGARSAEPGEFTRRAVLNGKMDLLEAEGVADLVAAETETQRRLALQQTQGAHSALLANWSGRLRRILAWQEALIDFPDEDLPVDVEEELLAETRNLAAEIAASAEETTKGMRVRQGLVVAITGLPNVGKSTLLNALVGRDAAITSPEPGTTRDTLEVWVHIAGIGVTLIDTAGLRETADPVEAEGVRRARAKAREADLVLHVRAGLGGGSAVTGGDRRTLHIANKIDLEAAPPDWIGVSARTGAGMDVLRARLEAELLGLTRVTDHPVLSRARHQSALADASAGLVRAATAEWPEIRGEELRLAMGALGRISGTVGVEDVLDTIFGAFCIGK